MTGLDHFLKAEELAAKAAEYLGQGDGQGTAAVWAAVAQVHALLALTEATQPRSGGVSSPSPGSPPRPDMGALSKGTTSRRGQRR